MKFDVIIQFGTPLESLFSEFLFLRHLFRGSLEFMQEDCDYNVSEIRSVLASMGVKQNDIGKSLSVLSGGEIIKLLLAKMLMGRYNILLMDEPSNFLDIPSLEALEILMKEYAGTIVFITHDNRLLDNVADVIYEIKDKKLNLVR
ncbi:putative ABC transporter ATP-binding protein YbiT [Caprobacter fermentans]|uniref:Putative ABC transporter ATP-binding protein YbiT n=1 Tax=Caproicibacter fermentans TaxID=2576756 RepID=A0A6N8HYD8_9FIRM|nr:putative ABC transporter ATP-binding protein YbiT [Caproicibacter fermentans]